MSPIANAEPTGLTRHTADLARSNGSPMTGGTSDRFPRTRMLRREPVRSDDPVLTTRPTHHGADAKFHRAPTNQARRPPNRNAIRAVADAGTTDRPRLDPASCSAARSTCSARPGRDSRLEPRAGAQPAGRPRRRPVKLRVDEAVAEPSAPASHSNKITSVVKPRLASYLDPGLGPPVGNRGLVALHRLVLGYLRGCSRCAEAGTRSASPAHRSRTSARPAAAPSPAWPGPQLTDHH